MENEHPGVEFNTLLAAKLLDKTVVLFYEVEWNARCSTPMGTVGPLRPHRCDSAE